MTQAVKEEYLAGVDRALLCYLPNRKELMAEARRMVDQFDEENPEATGEDLLGAFGTGEEFALSSPPCPESRWRRRSGKPSFSARPYRWLWCWFWW